MAFIPASETVHVTVEGSVDAQLTINNLYFQNSAAVTPVNMAALALGVQNWVGGSFAPLLSRDWSSTRVTVTDLSAVNSFVLDVPEVDVGGVDIEAAPNNVAACVSFRTGMGGRSSRGRNFVPAIPNSVITLNTLDEVFIGDLLAAYLELVGAGSFVAGWQWCVVSFVSAGVPRGAGLVQPVTTALMTTNKVKSMRSREVGHGA